LRSHASCSPAERFEHVYVVGLVVMSSGMHRTRQNADRLAAGMAWRDTGLVFTTHLGGPLEPRNVNRAWYVIRLRAALESVRLHDLRHSCASFMLVAGARHLGR
jgi:integrase